MRTDLPPRDFRGRDNFETLLDTLTGPKPDRISSTTRPDLSWPVTYHDSLEDFAIAGVAAATQEGVNPAFVDMAAADDVTALSDKIAPKGSLPAGEISLELSALERTSFVLSSGVRGFQLASAERARRADASGQQVA